MGGGAPSKTTQTTQTDLPAWVQPYAKQYLSTVSNLIAPNGVITPSPLPDQSVADLNPYQSRGLSQLYDMSAGSPALGQGASALHDVYLAAQSPGINDIKNTSPASFVDPTAMATYGTFTGNVNNPYLDAMYRDAASQLTSEYQTAIAPNILANAVKTGTVGGSGEMEAFDNAQQELAYGLGTLGANLYGGQYANERAAQLSAANARQAATANAAQTAIGERLAGYEAQISPELQMAGLEPSYLQASYYPVQQLVDAGNQIQQQQQKQLDTSYGNRYQTATWPYQAAQMWGQDMASSLGAGGTQVSVGKSSPSGGLK